MKYIFDFYTITSAIPPQAVVSHCFSASSR